LGWVEDANATSPLRDNPVLSQLAQRAGDELPHGPELCRQLLLGQPQLERRPYLDREVFGASGRFQVTGNPLRDLTEHQIACELGEPTYPACQRL
jgi:hypothetical protein